MVTYDKQRTRNVGVNEEIGRSSEVLGYLSGLSAHDSLQFRGKSILLQRYEDLGRPNVESALAAYLAKREIKHRKYDESLIFPFGVNLSQKEAVQQALENSMSVIEGPPGTGKTQTILNLIANIVASGQSVAVVSGNNSATENVQEKLEEYGYGFMTSLLGSSQKRKEFFENDQSDKPNLNGWEIKSEERARYADSLQKISTELEVLLENQRELAKVKEELSKLEVEQKYFEREFIGEYIDIQKHSFYRNWSSQRTLNFITQLEGIESDDQAPSFIAKAKYFIRYGIFKQKVIEKNRSNVIESLKKDYYIRNIANRKSKINLLESKLANQNYEQLLKDYQATSSLLFKSALHKKYKRINRTATKYSVSNYKYKFQEFIKDYPVVLSTTHSMLPSIPKGFLFDYLIIDEASQVDLVTGSLALASCKNVVVVGDVKQLPHIVSPQMKAISDKTFAGKGMHDAFNYTKYSMISSLMALYEDVLPITLLTEHYRCHPKIIGFCNERFYDNELIVMTEEKEADMPLKIYKTAPGNHARRHSVGEETGWYNVRQIEVMRDEILQQDHSKYEDIGIISPYRMHVTETNRYIGSPHLEVDTVHRFQGREKKKIVFTTVANDITPFIDDPNLINVAVSRAVDELVIVTSDRLFKQQGSYLGDLIRYIEYNSFSNVVESQKVSVFDLLYTEYSSALLKYRTSKGKVSEYESENLMYAVIGEVLSDPAFKSFKCVMHIPLNALSIDFNTLTAEERKFAENKGAHVDFLIYNRLDKEVLLAIEVDGVHYHRNNETQQKRDCLKDSILQKKALQLLRIATNESGEKERLIEKMRELVKVSGR